MARGERNAGWPGFFLAFSVLSAILMLTAQSAGGDVGAPGIYTALCRWSIPGLFMVWGMGALEGGKPALRAFFLGMVLPAFLLLVAWGAFYALLAHLLGGGALSLAGVWGALKSAAMGNTYFHLWVLYPLLGLYLVHPVVGRFTSSASRGEVLYFLALCFIFASLLPVWAAFHPQSVLAGLLDRMDVHLVLGWVGYYVGGWYLRHYTIGRISEFALYLLGILGVAVTLWGDLMFGGGSALWRGYTAPGVVFTAAGLCALFRYVLGVSDERSRRQSVSRLGGFALQIYLVHQVWPLLIRWLGIPAIELPAVLAIPAAALLYFLLSVPFGWLLAKLPGMSRLSP